MTQDRNIAEILKEHQTADWEQFPDLELYMDQLLSYVNRQQPFPSAEPALTKSMVNNYIKQEIIKRPNGKRYRQEHIAQLSMLVLLKEVLPIQDCQELFQEVGLYENTEETYAFFQESLTAALNSTAELLASAEGERDYGAEALRFALLSYASRRVAMALLQEAKDARAPETEEATKAKLKDGEERLSEPKVAKAKAKAKSKVKKSEEEE
ncbi:MAG: DUF1836 domain-containing protein [Eubacteriales bacterium]|nr:DUF1836 domain-containing protein [Eubacteriales bacterium]